MQERLGNREFKPIFIFDAQPQLKCIFFDWRRLSIQNSSNLIIELYWIWKILIEFLFYLFPKFLTNWFGIKTVLYPIIALISSKLKPNKYVEKSSKNQTIVLRYTRRKKVKYVKLSLKQKINVCKQEKIHLKTVPLLAIESRKEKDSKLACKLQIESQSKCWCARWCR